MEFVFLFHIIILIQKQIPNYRPKLVDFIYTDTWTSMGQEDEAEWRRQVFAPYQVNAKLVELAPKAWLMHCLPAHRGEEITGDLLDGDRSLVYEQAENRLHAQKAIVEHLLLA